MAALKLSPTEDFLQVQEDTLMDSQSKHSFPLNKLSPYFHPNKKKRVREKEVRVQ